MKRNLTLIDFDTPWIVDWLASLYRQSYEYPA